MPNSPKSATVPFAAACLAIALFSVMDAEMKGLSIAIGAFSAMFWRVLIGSALGGALFLVRREAWPTRPALRIHILRGTVAAIMTVAFFYGIARVPMAEAVALSFIAPLITLYLATVLLGEKISRNAIGASILGITGVIIIAAARIGDVTYDDEAMKGMGAIFISAVFYAYNLILQRQQAQVATPSEIAFFQSLVVAVLLGLAAPWIAVVPSAAQWPHIILCAVLAMCSLLLFSWAYARAEAQILVTVEYTAFIWAAIFGWLYFREPVTLSTLIGTALIVTGCFIATRQKPEYAAVTAL
jgi:S-adenosylmethionine uptake transporter